MWCSASSFNFTILTFLLMSSSSYLRILSRLPVTFVLPSVFPSAGVLYCVCSWENSSLIKIWKKNWYEDPYTFLIISRSILLSHVSEVVEKVEMHIRVLCPMTFLSIKPCRSWDKVEKYCTAGQATDDNLAHAHCMLQIHTLRICNTHCFSTKTMVARTHLSVTFFTICLSC
jgi:hypothetical protein